MKFYTLFITALLLVSVPARADEEYNASFDAGGGASNIRYMEDEDMDFSSMDAEDAFASDRPVSTPMIQKRTGGADAFTPPPSSDARQNVPVTQIPVAEKKTQRNNAAPLPKNTTLTDTLQRQEKETMPSIPLPDVSGTWVDKLANSVPSLSGSQTGADTPSSAEAGTAGNAGLQNMVDNSRRANTRSNASVFDISGIMLRMNLAQAEKAMMTRGFKLISQKLEIPNFIKWRNEEKCRGNGVVGYERLMNCVVEIAKKNNHQYVETAKFSKFPTKEEIEIKLTSNFTGNKIYHVMYKSMSGRVVGSGAKAAYLRNIKVFDFWKKINQKYGAPDNKDEVTWGLGGNKPYMKASTGFLLLEDPMLRELDYTRMSREDQRFMNTDLYSF